MLPSYWDLEGAWLGARLLLLLLSMREGARLEDRLAWLRAASLREVTFETESLGRIVLLLTSERGGRAITVLPE